MSLISALVNQKIDYIYSVSLDKYSDRTKTQVYKDVPCRWETSFKRSITVGSDKLIYYTIAWILPSYSIAKDYIIEKDGEDYEIALIQYKYDMTGKLDHYKVFLR
jgi:hypothetical protein